MNVVILTPDRVGSTLLQRVITIYMQLAQLDQPVINLHELTNGLMPYWSDVFNAEVLGKPESWGYHQTLPEIVQLLERAQHYKTSRLAHYHLQRRQDSRADQLGFYQYINDKFFVIVARRNNLLEHALSWCIYVRSRLLNVYSAQEKFNTFADIYHSGIIVEKDNLVKYLNAYREYLAWTDRHFRVDSYFNYEQHLPDLEKYVLQLPIFENRQQQDWKSAFDISFADWNRCHYLTSNMAAVPALPNQRSAYSVATVNQNLTRADQTFLQTHGLNYLRSRQHVQELVDKKILVTGIPIKLQTMQEKQHIVRNWTDVVTWYNQWVADTGLGEPFTDSVLQQLTHLESQNYHAVEKADAPHESPHLTSAHQQG
jgi:hypothetical protein